MSQPRGIIGDKGGIRTIYFVTATIGMCVLAKLETCSASEVL